jgi:thiamine biosynthesis protein ThiI
MLPPGAGTVLVRYGEIGVKSRHVQRRMEDRLRENLSTALDRGGFDATVDREFTRLYVDTAEGIDGVTDVVTDTFGVVSASPAVRTEPTLAAINAVLAESASEQYDGGSFAVRARRAGEDHTFSSEDIEEQGGSAVWTAAMERGVDPVVDLDDPDLTFYVECRPEGAFVFLEKHTGPGGLPLGTQEPVVALVSGGIDSPVAAWETMKRGCPVYPLYVDLGEYGGVDNRMRAVETVGTLGRYVPDGALQLRVAPGGEAIERIVAGTDTCRMLVVRRFMLRVAERVAGSVGAAGIVTGESIGQKSSQTSANLRVTDRVTSLPVHRPLATRDKTEITDRAKAIGSYEDSTIDTGCHRLAPENPATGPPLSTVREAEPDDIEALVADAVDGIELIDPR